MIWDPHQPVETTSQRVAATLFGFGVGSAVIFVLWVLAALLGFGSN